MAVKPILFSAPMVRALLDGRKTMTRRLITSRNTFFNGSAWSRDAKAQTWNWAGAWVDPGPSPAGNPGPYLKLPWLAGDADNWEGTVHRLYPATQPSDLLWVRETIARIPASAYRCSEGVQQTINPADLYEAAVYRASFDRSGNPGWKPSIHMPRWASRLTLAVTAVKVERLQDISHEDAIAEGIQRSPHGNGDQWCDYPLGSSAAGWIDPRLSFASLWRSINGAGAWEANPWVVALTFTVHRANVEDVAGKA